LKFPEYSIHFGFESVSCWSGPSFRWERWWALLQISFSNLSLIFGPFGQLLAQKNWNPTSLGFGRISDEAKRFLPGFRIVIFSIDYNCHSGFSWGITTCTRFCYLFVIDTHFKALKQTAEYIVYWPHFYIWFRNCPAVRSCYFERHFHYGPIHLLKCTISAKVTFAQIRFTTHCEKIEITFFLIHPFAKMHNFCKGNICTSRPANVLYWNFYSIKIK